MDDRIVDHEENEIVDGQDQIFSPFLPEENQEKRKNSFSRNETLKNSSLESKWSHQQDLDDFFIRIYQYHQNHGFFCILLSEIFALVYVDKRNLHFRLKSFIYFRQFLFIVSFTLLLVQCIDYSLLFQASPFARNTTDKIQIHQIIEKPSQCLRKYVPPPPSLPSHHSFSMNWITSLCLILAIIYWFYRFIRAIYNLQSFYTIRTFYHQALDIKPVRSFLV